MSFCQKFRLPNWPYVWLVKALNRCLVIKIAQLEKKTLSRDTSMQVYPIKKAFKSTDIELNSLMPVDRKRPTEPKGMFGSLVLRLKFSPSSLADAKRWLKGEKKSRKKESGSTFRPHSLRWKNMLKHCYDWFVVREKHRSGWKDKSKSTNYKTSEQGLSPF